MKEFDERQVVMSVKWACNECCAINPACSSVCHNCKQSGAFLKGPEWNDDWVPIRQWLSKQKLPVHVMPIRDIKEHEESLSCWCIPKICRENQDMIFHNAFTEEYRGKGDQND